MAMPFWLKSSPCDQASRKKSDFLFLPMAALSPVASEPGTLASVSVIDMETNDGEDYLLIDMPEAEAAPAEASPGIEIDPTITKETLDAQLAEMEKIMASLGLGAKQVSGTEVQGSDPPAGFVTSSGTAANETLKILEEETMTLLFNKGDGTFMIEGWESLLESSERFARSVTHGELNSLLAAFQNSSWTATLVSKVLEVYGIAKRAAEHNELLKARHISQWGGSMINPQEKDPGAAPTMVCSDCSAPWGSFSKCMLCKGTSPIDLRSIKLSSRLMATLGR